MRIKSSYTVSSPIWTKNVLLFKVSCNDPETYGCTGI